MITGVQDIYLNVSDIERAVSFYREVLGLSVAEQDAYWTALDAGGVRIGLHWTEGAAVPVVPRNAHGAFAGVTLTLRSTNLHQDTLRLKKSGATILGESDEIWGKLTVFEDPDGNVLKLMEPPV